jgi:uncharacterized protein YjbI with pentapeptide repeats
MCSQLRRARLQEADLEYADLSGANLLRADLGKANMQFAKLNTVACGVAAREGEQDPIKLESGSHDTHGLASGREKRSETDARSKQETILTGANLTGATLVGAELIGARLSLAALDGVDLRQSELCFAKMDQANLVGKALLRNSRLTCASVRDADLSMADLERVKAEAVDFANSEMKGVNLTQATLSCFDCGKAECFEYCRDSLEIWECDDREEDARQECLDERKLCANCRTRDGKCASFRRAYMKGAKLIQADLRGADIREADLREADLSNAVLTGAKLARTDLRRAKGLSCAQLRQAEGWENSFRDEPCGTDIPRPPSGEGVNENQAQSPLIGPPATTVQR